MKRLIAMIHANIKYTKAFVLHFMMQSEVSNLLYKNLNQTTKQLIDYHCHLSAFITLYGL